MEELRDKPKPVPPSQKLLVACQQPERTLLHEATRVTVIKATLPKPHMACYPFDNKWAPKGGKQVISE